MIGWHVIKFKTDGWKENKEIICNLIKPTVEELEKLNDITSFFFLEYYGGDEQKVIFVFNGNKEKVIKKIKQFREVTEEIVGNYDPRSESYRFGEDYMLGIKLFELGSRLALYSIDEKNPVDKSGGRNIPIILTLRHAFLQNLGYTTLEEINFSQQLDSFLLKFYEICMNTKLK